MHAARSPRQPAHARHLAQAVQRQSSCPARSESPGPPCLPPSLLPFTNALRCQQQTGHMCSHANHGIQRHPRDDTPQCVIGHNMHAAQPPSDAHTPGSSRRCHRLSQAARSKSRAASRAVKAPPLPASHPPSFPASLPPSATPSGVATCVSPEATWEA